MKSHTVKILKRKGWDVGDAKRFFDLSATGALTEELGDQIVFWDVEMCGYISQNAEQPLAPFLLQNGNVRHRALSQVFLQPYLLL